VNLLKLSHERNKSNFILCVQVVKRRKYEMVELELVKGSRGKSFKLEYGIIFTSIQLKCTL